MNPAARIMFLYWGRRGAMSKFAREAAREALALPGVEAAISVSKQNEDFQTFLPFGEALFPVDTFEGGSGAAKGFWRIPQLRRQLARRLKRDGAQAVITLMPHVWSLFMIGAARQAGARYVTVVHDADSHPGDRTAIVNRLLLAEAKRADAVVTLSDSVREKLAGSELVPPERLVTLFHPDYSYLEATSPRIRDPGRPLRLLFFGRIMRYKGLGIFVEAAELLRARGTEIEIGVYGEGSIAPYEERLAALGATVVNRWLDNDGIAALLPQYDAVALSHTEASQSGVAAAAFGAGLPVIATPVGGLKEQVQDGVTGVLARSVTAQDFAEAVRRLADDPALYSRIAERLCATAGERSMKRFVERIVEVALNR